MSILFKNLIFQKRFARIFTNWRSGRTSLSFFNLPIFQYNQAAACSSARGNYNVLSSDDISYFKSVLDPSGILTDADDIEPYNIDWLKSYRGSGPIVLRPRTTEEVSTILSYCSKRNLAICPQGGNTGLVGGSIPIYDEIVLSTTLMNKILSFDNLSGVLACQAGCVLENLDNYASDMNFIVPIDLGAKGSCQIGGNIATNAGGLRLVRYGSLHANVLGLEIVLANGEVLDCMSTLRKDNTGYDLKHLFIGSEGTLGVITQVALLCYPRPSATTVAFLGCHSFSNMLESVKVIKHMLPDVLSSLEMLDAQAADTVHENLNVSIPIEKHPFYILIEVSGSNAGHNDEKLNDCLSTLMEKKLINDGTMASEPSRLKAIWSVRERITESLLLEGCSYKYDISLPLSEFYAIVEILRKRLGESVTRCCAYGHLGDGNLHFNATTKEFDPEVLNIIEPFIYEWTAKRRGSISAEHGIGYKKKKFLHLNKTPAAIALMKSVKHVLDPHKILNPYKVIP